MSHQQSHKPTKQRPKVQISISFTAGQHRQLAEIAASEDRSISHIVRAAVDKEVLA